jgi:tetratricopeptide (TPR) repeat protein
MNLDARLSLQVDVEHPWLGLESFSESTRRYFFGRDAEAAELLQRLRLHPLLVFYGCSGLGKTSLLRATLIPELERLGERPAFYRISYRRGENSPLEQLAGTLEAGESFDVPGFALPEDAASHLWLHLHRRERKDLITHLILDQFEEVFTIGAEWSGAEAEVRQAIAILVQGAIPKPVETLLDEGATFLKHFHLDVPPLPVLLSLRQDYVFALNRWRSHLTQLGQNHFELRALRGPAAFDAVFKPGELRCHYRGEVNEENKAVTGLPPIVTKKTAERIVRFIAQKGEEVPMEEIEAVPPILSLLCRELNERRLTPPAGTPKTPVAQITFRESEADIETIIAAFYERCLTRRPDAVRIFIEEELVSPYSGARLQQDERSILKVFTDGCKIPGTADERHAAGYGSLGVARACLEDLVNQRLLTAVSGGENPSYELVHDLLAAVVEKSRTAREAREQADRRAEADRKAKEDAEASAREAADRAAVLDAAVQKETQARREADQATRRARWLAIAAVLVAIVAVVAFTVALVAGGAAQAARERTVASKKAADGLIHFLQHDIHDTLSKLGHLELMRTISMQIMKYYEDYPPEASDVGALRERATALTDQGNLFLAQNNLASALKSYRDGLAIWEKLAKPTNAGSQRDLSYSYERVGDVQRAQGDLSDALKSYRACLIMREKLTKQDPTNADLQRDLSSGYERVGDVQKAQGDLAGGLKSYRDSLIMREKLTKQDPTNAGWQRDLSNSYERIGDVQKIQGDLAGALKSYRDSLAIREKLTRQDPTDAYLQHDLSNSYERIGDVQKAQGDFAGALKSCRDSLAIA